MTTPWLLLSDGATPTEDIYFYASVAPAWRSAGVSVTRRPVKGWAGMKALPMRRRWFGANVLICRSLLPSWTRWLERHRHRFGRIVYLIDDDLRAAAEDPDLPTGYRERMAGLAAQQPRWLKLADEVITCAPALADRMRRLHRNVSVLTPPMLASLPSLEHFDQPPAAETPWRIGFHGTRAHLADLAWLGPALKAMQSQRCDTRLEIMLGQHTPADLSTLPRTVTPAPLPWASFRRYQRECRMHIGLAPLRPTPFNMAKSFIKFFDITAMGGVGLYSDREPYRAIVRHGENGFLLEDDPLAWRDALQWLLDNPEQAARMASSATATARRMGDTRLTEAFWSARIS
ncbi:glycosyltransferase [Kushneria aurantia]|uniref:Glycosyltransferase n=1 Tax=Kushneria aurantia TaxID=504092 RepID=A0ABV6FZA1_9GAMM|nr:glycosyltransferase [Kushneria aurantia]